MTLTIHFAPPFVTSVMDVDSVPHYTIGTQPYYGTLNSLQCSQTSALSEANGFTVM